MRTLILAVVGSTFAASGSTRGQWVDFNETPSRLVAASGVGAGDAEEKDYAWGDLDKDGDIDLVCVRKEPFTSTGKRVNVLFMNEGTDEGHAVDGVLVDRTALYATAADVGGDQGFNTATNDRDVVLVDVNGDTWLDVVTATTLTDNQAKHISHPRVYKNLGNDAQGNWLGLRFENGRIPQMHATAGPRFCSVAAGDLTGDGAPDLYFGDYDSGPAQILDYNNRLLINNGNGFFTDQTTTRLTFEMYNSAFGAASVIADMNGDGVLDVVKQTSLSQPLHVAVTYNNPGNEGFFNLYDLVNQNAPYFVSVDDLNQDGRLDIVITDDGTDRYLLNQGNDGQGQANFTTFTFPASDGFGSNSVIADLNNDGHKDVIIADVDVDIPGCTRTTFIYRNLGNLPNVGFQKQGEPIPNADLVGVHDVGVFDLDGDGWLDIVLGKCNGTEIWMNQPPGGLLFAFPGGLPAYLPPDQTTTVQVQVTAIGGSPVAGSGRIYLSVDGGAFVQSNMTHLGGNLYQATLPALPCTHGLAFYFSADINTGGTFFDPPNAPATSYSAIAADGTDIILRDEIEGSVSAWSVTNTNLTAGAWVQADPNGTSFNTLQAAPADDATQGTENVKAFVTQNGPPGGAAGADDIDGGPTRLLAPVIDLAGTDALISYSRWFFSDGTPGTHVPDFLTVDVSNDGGNSWVAIPEHTTGGTGSAWQTVTFRVGDYISPTANVRVRFSASDNPNNSVTEAGIDNFQVEVFLCPQPDGACCLPGLTCQVLDVSTCGSMGGTPLAAGTSCAGDSDGDGTIDGCDGCPSDPNKTSPGVCGCGVSDLDSDGDGVPNCNDGCPNDPNKTSPGTCGCGVAETDSDGDGVPNCNDGCPNDPNKTSPGTCGCGVAETDSDGDGVPNCNDGCPNDPNKTSPGTCGCGVAETDSDGDGVPNCNDGCPNDPNKTSPGACGCGVAETDSDGDGQPDCVDPDDDNDGVPDGEDLAPLNPLLCKDSDGDGCDDCSSGTFNPANDGVDSDGDGVCNTGDGCPNDPNKTSPGACGCGVAETDSDGDGVPNCNDGCPNDANKTTPGTCGCGVAETDSDGDGVPNCNDGCPNDPNKTSPGACGCGVAETDSDGDGVPNCNDGCPNDPNKTTPGACGCGVAEINTDGDGDPDCVDPDDDNDGVPDGEDLAPLNPLLCKDSDGDGCDDCSSGTFNPANDGVDSDGDGVCNTGDGCPNDPNKTSPGACGCGVAETDSDGDGVPNCNDGCPNDPNKTSPGACGCGVAETDSDGDGVPNCNDGCPNDPNKTSPGTCGCGVAETDTDGDGQPDCVDPDDDNDGVPDGEDLAPLNPLLCKDSDGDGCDDCSSGTFNPANDGVDSDGDGVCNTGDGCPNDPDKTSPGTCGCGVADVDSDGDRVPDCDDPCPADPDDLCVPEGCCLADGMCQDVAPTACADVGGTPQGVGSTCAEASCPQPEGACCFTDGTCGESTEVDCVQGAGVYQGDRSACAMINCPPPSGACCAADGSCSEADEVTCVADGGIYDGNFSLCATAECPEPCPADVTGDGLIDVQDLVTVVLGWGNCIGPQCPADVNDDGVVDVQDLVSVVLAWGACP